MSHVDSMLHDHGERTYQFRIARYSAGFGLAGALLGTVGGLLGGLLITHEQINAQADQAQKSFLQNQRQVVYTQMLALDSEAKEFELDLEIDIGKNGSPKRTELNADILRSRTLVNRIAAASSALNVIGSPAPIDSGGNLLTVHSLYIAELLSVVSTIVDRDKQQEVKYRAILKGERAKRDAASSDYLADIRQDLGADATQS